MERGDRGDRFDRGDRPERGERPDRSERFPKKERIVRAPDEGMLTFRIEVGYQHGVKPGNIVGAIANEGGIDSKYIGRIEIYDDYSVLDMPNDLPTDVIQHLGSLKVAGQMLRLRPDGEGAPASAHAHAPAPAPARAPAPRAAAPAAHAPAPTHAAHA